LLGINSRVALTALPPNTTNPTTLASAWIGEQSVSPGRFS